MARKFLQSPVVNALVVAGGLFLVMGWPAALGGGIGTYFASKRLYAKRS